MKFGEFPLGECEGAVLAHSLRLDGRLIKKGKVLDAADISAIGESGRDKILVAILQDGDIGEDEAARRIATLLSSDFVEASSAGTGRVNLHATCNGLFLADATLVNSINAVDPGITLATLSNKTAVSRGRMVATVKIIPYAVSKEPVEKAEKLASQDVLGVAPFESFRVAVISTQLPSLKESVIAKTVRVLKQRLVASGSDIVSETIVDHEKDALKKAMMEAEKNSDLVIVFGASAISDENDIIPSALEAAGGKTIRFGMPVDPGNLLLLGALNDIPVIGAPGCARSPAQNGFDFVLDRIFAGVDVTFEGIGGMGVGGLLMEIGSRPSPREKRTGSKTEVAAIVLAAGQSKRMGAQNKLLASLDDMALVARVAFAAKGSRVHETILVTGHEAEKIRNTLSETDVFFVHNPNYEEGLATSLAAGISAINEDASHALILLGDMPSITSAMIDKMITAAEAAPSGSIIMATNSGKRGNPVLWPRSYFDALKNVAGDIGAKHILFENSEKIVEVELGEAASLDIDTKAALKQIGGEFPSGD